MGARLFHVEHHRGVLHLAAPIQKVPRCGDLVSRLPERLHWRCVEQTANYGLRTMGKGVRSQEMTMSGLELIGRAACFT